MRLASFVLLAAAALVPPGAALFAQPRIDNVLVRMVPPGSTSLVGARMDQLRATDFYRKLVERRKLPQVDEFAKDTGFDPRRDVRELLFASTATGGVLLARGTFHVNPEPLKDAQTVRHGGYAITASGSNGFCILDATLAAAGDLPSLEAALDEWKSGAHTAARPLLARAGQVAPGSQFWGVSTGFAGFLAEHMPRAASGIDFSKIFKGLEDTWFQADFSGNFQFEVRGVTATDQDAVSLRDTAKGLIGFGRLSVPENQPEMLKLWDGITVEQQGRAIAIRADVPPELIDRLVQMVAGAGRGGGRGRSRP